MEYGVLGEQTPVQLLDTVMFLIGVNCSLRGGQEHRNLRRPGFNEQITIGVDDDNVKCPKFVHDVHGKNNQGGLTRRFVQPKPIHMYQNPNKACCPVRLRKVYWTTS